MKPGQGQRAVAPATALRHPRAGGDPVHCLHALPPLHGAAPGTTIRVVEKQFYVYILASRRNGTLTTNLRRRVEEHKAKAFPGFTQQYGVDQLVHFEIHRSAEAAILREKQLKKWNRAWKISLIEESNPRWEDLYDAICR